MTQDTYYFKKRTDFDSTEEYHFYLWTLEALEHKIIKTCKYHPWTATLSNSVSIKVPKPTKRKPQGKRKIHLLRAIQYTPDWIIEIFPERNYFLQKNLVPVRTDQKKRRQYEPHYEGTILIIDVKGTYAGRKNNSAITFPIKQKWVFHQYGIYINKIIPAKFFKQFWCPRLAAFTLKTNKRAEVYKSCIFVEDWLLENVSIEKGEKNEKS